MNPIEQAVKKAIEAGYGNDDWRRWAEQDRNELKGFQFAELYGTDAQNQHFLDPSFWKSLGKALGWPAYLKAGGLTSDEEAREDVAWKVMWHRFIDHLAEGKKAEDFFAELLQ